MQTNVSLVRIWIFIGVFASALFTGLMACFLIVVDRTLASLDGPNYTRIMQELIRNADHPPLVPMMVIISLLAPVVVLILLRKQTGTAAFRYSALALVMMLVVLYITIGLNVPINNAIMAWNADAPPTDWSAIRNHWHELNLYRTPASALSFAFNVMAIALLAPTDNTTKE